jgi:hypothetical protein
LFVVVVAFFVYTPNIFYDQELTMDDMLYGCWVVYPAGELSFGLSLFAPSAVSFSPDF